MRWSLESLGWTELAALLVAFLALVYATRANWRHDVLRARLERLEKALEEQRVRPKRAVLTCCMTSARTLKRLFIKNVGDGPAHSLALIANGIPANEHPAFQVNSGTDLAALKGALDPGSKVALLYRVGVGTPDLSPLVLTWTNEDGSPGEYKAEVPEC